MRLAHLGSTEGMGQWWDAYEHPTENPSMAAKRLFDPLISSTVLCGEEGTDWASQKKKKKKNQSTSL